MRDTSGKNKAIRENNWQKSKSIAQKYTHTHTCGYTRLDTHARDNNNIINNNTADDHSGVEDDGDSQQYVPADIGRNITGYAKEDEWVTYITEYSRSHTRYHTTYGTMQGEELGHTAQKNWVIYITEEVGHTTQKNSVTTKKNSVTYITE